MLGAISLRISKQTTLMPRRLRFCPDGFPVHIIQRGINRQACFACDEDIAAYAHWLAEGAIKFEVDIHAWVFMTNHVHLLLTPKNKSAISQLMQYLGRLYVRRFNYRYSRSGSLFDGRFKSSLIQDDHYLLTCLQYIELNPIRAGLVLDPGDYKWSSYQSHAFGKSVGMWTPHAVYSALGKSQEGCQRIYRNKIGDSISTEALTKIRHCANTGLVLGTKRFREEIEAMKI